MPLNCVKGDGALPPSSVNSGRMFDANGPIWITLLFCVTNSSRSERIASDVLGPNWKSGLVA